MGQPLICFEHFSFQYRAQAKPTLNDINLTIHAGEKILIVGPSGSGKSTLAHCINGLIPFNYRGESTGDLRIGGKRTREMSLFELSQEIGTVLQDPDGQFVGLTSGEDIAFSLENDCVMQDEMRQRVREAAGLVGVEAFLDASPYDLSGGQKQRVSIAGVIIDDVRVLLFDEPLANLDPATGKQAIDLIDRIQSRTDTTVIIIEHRLEDVLYRPVDRIVLMEGGRIVADETPQALLSGPMLGEVGIREPLYVTALKYANVPVTPQKQPQSIETLLLSDFEEEAVRRWLRETHPASLPARNEPLLSIEGVSFAYDKKAEPVVKDVSFAICAGEMTAIVGMNGAGKSTLAKLICGFEKPDGGRIALRGVDLAGESIADRARHIGYVMQNPNQMISKAMIMDEVALGPRARGMPEEEVQRRAEEALRVCGLHPFRKWPVSALSFGQKKRLTIASVLVMEPEVIILDEPTAGQDFRHYTEIMEFLCGLNAAGITVLMITHDMHLMLEYAPRALVFTGGRLLADCATAALLCDPELTKTACLKETSLYTLAKRCGIADEPAFVQHFIDYDREVRGDGQLRSGPGLH